MNWKDICPNCGSDDIEGGDTDYRTYDNQGFEYSVLYSYGCWICDCEWTVTERTIVTMEIDKQGDKVDERPPGIDTEDE